MLYTPVHRPNEEASVEHKTKPQTSTIGAIDPQINRESGNYNEKEAAPRAGCLSYLNETWLLDVVGLVGSAAALACIIALLGLYEDEVEPVWSHMSLNTAIAWLSTAAKGFVLMPVTRNLGQLKWIWFAQRSHSLRELLEFDEASRGVVGSLKLLWTRRARHIQTLGCLAMILALGLVPFVQNMLRFYPKAIPDPTQVALITNGSTYSTLAHWVDPVLKANVYGSLFNSDSSQPWAKPNYVCASGNCTYPRIPTLAARASCTDLSDRIQVDCGSCESKCNCTVAVPNGPSTWLEEDVGGYGLLVTTTENPLVYANTSSMFPAIQYLKVKNTSRVYSFLSRSTEYVATECALELCAAWVQDAVVNSTLTTVVQDWACTPAGDANYTLSVPSSFLPQDDTYDSDDFYVVWEAANSLVGFITTIFQGSFYTISDVAEWNKDGSALLSYAAVDTMQSIWSGDFSGCRDGEDHLTCAVTNVANALTKTFRDAAYIKDGSSLADATTGETMITMSFVSVAWAWLALPVVVWVAALALLCGTVLRTRSMRLPTWHNNILPLLFMSHPDTVDGGVDNYRLPVHLSSRSLLLRSQGIDTRVRPDGTSARLVADGAS